MDLPGTDSRMLESGDRWKPAVTCGPAVAATRSFAARLPLSRARPVIIITVPGGYWHFRD